MMAWADDHDAEITIGRVRRDPTGRESGAPVNPGEWAVLLDNRPPDERIAGTVPKGIAHGKTLVLAIERALTKVAS